jgi:hypothetical protein
VDGHRPSIGCQTPKLAALDEPKPSQPRGLPDSLRSAIDRTLSSLGDARATSAADLPGEAVERAGELLDEVARRGRDAGSGIVRHGTGVGARVLDAVGDTLRRRGKPKVEGE